LAWANLSQKRRLCLCGLGEFSIPLSRTNSSTSEEARELLLAGPPVATMTATWRLTRSAASGANLSKEFAPDSPLEEAGFELSVPVGDR
jgi:hypothetical protein